MGHVFVAGSELTLAVDAAKELEGSGKKVRVVSFPSWELFEEQDQVFFILQSASLQLLAIVACSPPILVLTCIHINITCSCAIPL